MKQILVAVVVACSAMVAWGQASNPKTPPGFTLEDFLGAGYRIEPSTPVPPPPPKRELGPIDKWRFESCQTDAAKAPTSQGVHAGLRVCREKFGQ
jgi:hypothetical protein